MTPARRREWALRLLLAAASPVFVFFLSEGALRLAGYGFPTGFLIRLAGQDADTTNQHFGRRFFPAAIARTPVPALIPARKAPDTFRMFILGESAAMGVPEPAFSFGRVLEVMLRERYPGVNFEVVNAAMTAINSHAIPPIARDCAGRRPDLFVIFMGNNEVVGPYGPGTVFTGAPPNLALIRLAVWQSSTRLGQLAGQAVAAVRKPQVHEWRGMEMFLDRQVPADSPALGRMYAYFRRNLEDIVSTGRRAGAGVILATVPTNLRDNPAFASMHRSGIATGALGDWDRLFAEGRRLEESGERAPAIEQYRAAAAIDDRFAELHFRIAGCLLALDRVEEARKHYALARDLDALRFRADSRINAMIREVALKAGGGVRLVDAEREFGMAGRELFYEHVHLRFSGNYRIAASVLVEVEKVAPAWLRKRARVAPPSVERAAELLAFTGWNQYKLASQMAAMTARPPFTNQLDHEEARRAALAELADLKRQFAGPEALAAARRTYSEAISRYPSDMYFQLGYAELLRESGDYTGAAGQWRTLLGWVPGVMAWHASLGAVLADAGRFDESIAEYRRALAIDSQFDVALFGLGAAAAKAGRYQEAVAWYGKALAVNPASAEAHNNLALALLRLGRSSEALANFSEATRLRPDYAEAHDNLGLALSNAGRIDEAAAHFTEAVRLEPEFAGAHYNLAAMLNRQDQTDAAARHYEAALKLKPDYAEAHFGLGGVLARTRRVREAIAAFEAAARARPDFAEAHYNLGLLLSGQGKLPEAIAEYTEALRINPRYAEAYNNLGTALARSGDLTAAARHFSKAVEINPNYAAARANLERARRAGGSAR